MDAKFYFKCLKAVLVCAALCGPAVFAAETSSPDLAVSEYLQLRATGKNHKDAVKAIRVKFQLTDQQLEEAADRISMAGAPVGEAQEVVAQDHRGPAQQ